MTISLPRSSLHPTGCSSGAEHPAAGRWWDAAACRTIATFSGWNLDARVKTSQAAEAECPASRAEAALAAAFCAHSSTGRGCAFSERAATAPANGEDSFDSSATAGSPFQTARVQSTRIQSACIESAERRADQGAFERSSTGSTAITFDTTVRDSPHFHGSASERSGTIDGSASARGAHQHGPHESTANQSASSLRGTRRSGNVGSAGRVATFDRTDSSDGRALLRPPVLRKTR